MTLEEFETALISDARYKSYIEEYRKHEVKNDQKLIKESLWPMLTGETLMGDDKINYRGKTMYMIEDKFLSGKVDFEELPEGEYDKSYTFFHLGHKLSGHQKLIHGGLLATILDELTCRLAFQNFHSKKGVTANLNLNYRKPCFINTYVVIKCEVLKKTGRKCQVKGCVYKFDLGASGEVEKDENLLTECECLVVEPKWVNSLKHSDKE